jgi:phosphatidylserine/phosphatidylglycerophosphate/cardiolipin synthase-like enzyme
VFEQLGSDTSYSYYPVMEAANLPNLQVRTDGNSRMMHHKVLIIDRRIVVFGSYNFTDNANRRNDENIVIVHDPTFAGYFVEEFEAVWAEAGG